MPEACARDCSCRINSVISACPWDDTALSNGASKGVMISITSNSGRPWMAESEACFADIKMPPTDLR